MSARDSIPGLGNPNVMFAGDPRDLGAPGSFYAPDAGQLPPGIGQMPENVIRIGEQTLWSSYLWNSGDALARGDFEVFVTGLGSIGQGYGAKLSRAETNLREAARIPNGYSFLTLGFALHPYYSGGNVTPNALPVSAFDLNNLQNHGVFAWRFLQTTIEISPFVLIGAGGGIFGTTADTGAAYGSGGSRVALNNGPGSLWVYQQFPMKLYSGVTFAVAYLFGDNAANVDGDANGNASDLNLRTMLVGRFDVGLVG